MQCTRHEFRSRFSELLGLPSRSICRNSRLNLGELGGISQTGFASWCGTLAVRTDLATAIGRFKSDHASVGWGVWVFQYRFPLTVNVAHCHIDDELIPLRAIGAREITFEYCRTDK